MKKAFKITIFTILLSSIALCEAQQTASIPPPTSYSLVAQDGNSRLWKNTEYQLSPAGKAVPERHYVKELQTGLNYWTGTGWQASDPSFEVSPDGEYVFANKLQTKVQLSANLAESNSVVITTPDGIVLGSTPVAIGLYDAASGNSLILASITNCTGTLVGNNKVQYRNALVGNGISASIIYTLNRASFSQDVVFGQNIDPSNFGFPTNSTRIQIFTAFDAPTPVQLARPLYSEQNQAIRSQMASPDFIDHTLKFGRLTFGPGHAFSTTTGNPFRGAPIAKEYRTIAGQPYLIESIEYKAIQNEMQALPHVALSQPDRTKMLENIRSGYAAIPAPHATDKATFKRGKPLFASRSASKGVMADYVALSGTEPDPLILQEGTTYFVSGPVDCNDAIIEGGAVIKYLSDTNACIEVDSNLTCQTATYRPAICTGVDDDSVGDSMSGVPNSGYTGTIQSGSYANPALYLPNGGNVNGVRILYAQTALEIAGNALSTISDSQIVGCGQGVAWGGSGSLTMNNCLAANCPWYVHGPPPGSTGSLIVDNWGHRTFDLVNCTVDRWYSLDYSGIDDSIAATNCIFSWIGFEDPGDPYQNATYCFGSDNGFYEFSFEGYESPFGDNPIVDSNYPYQTVGAGNYYLADNTLRGKGNPNIGPALFSDLATKTTWPPMVYSNESISVPMTFSPQAQRDTNANSDLGYNYPPVDDFFGGVNASSNLTFTAGTVAGWFELDGSRANAYGISLANGTIADFEGTAADPCGLVVYASVQEGGNGQWTYQSWPGGGIINQTVNDPENAPLLRARFTRLSHAAIANNTYRDGTSGQALRVEATDCEFDGGSGGYNLFLAFTNCLFYGANNNEQCSESQFSWETYREIFRNCTFHNGQMWQSHSESPPYWKTLISDCSFDGTTFSLPTNGLTCDYNAFVTNADRLPILGTDDVVVTNYDWQSIGSGNFYLPPDSALRFHGSTNANFLGLYWFTTQTNQALEGTNVVDIGYHYQALDLNDGTPLWQEEAADPNNPDNGILSVTIDSPTNGAAIQ